MNDTERAAPAHDDESWLLYLRDLADRLGLKDWDFFVTVNDDTSPYGATCAIVVGQKRAALGFPPSFDNLTPSNKRLTATHELLHCHLDRWKIIYNRLAPLLTDREYIMMELAFRDVMEEGVDGIATAIAPFLPLPEGREIT